MVSLEGSLSRSLALLERLHDVPMRVGKASYIRDEGPLARASIFQDIPRVEKDAVVAAAIRDPRRDRAVGCIVGMAVGDAIGHPLEFLPQPFQGVLGERVS